MSTAGRRTGRNTDGVWRRIVRVNSRSLRAACVSATALRILPERRIGVKKPAASNRDYETAGSRLLAKMMATGFVGMWEHRKDIGDSTEYVRMLREQIQTRGDRTPPVE